MEDDKIFPEGSEAPDSEREEKLHEENELLRMKIQAQFGGTSGAASNIPPELENEFFEKCVGI